jgi:hypothetical protein
VSGVVRQRGLEWRVVGMWKDSMVEPVAHPTTLTCSAGTGISTLAESFSFYDLDGVECEPGAGLMTLAWS